MVRGRVRAFVGITDIDWFSFLASRPDVDEVNFWQPSGATQFRALAPGELFLFKLRAPRRSIVGGALFAYSTILPLSLAWDAFQEKNGASSLEEMRLRIARLRRAATDLRSDYAIGCVLLVQPFFLREPDWITAPTDWRDEIVRGKTYDLTAGEGKKLWAQLVGRMPATMGGVEQPTERVPLVAEPRYGAPVTVLPRLGQGTFRVLVTDAYARRCAVTEERTLPVLEAAHVRPYGKSGPHDPRNGLLLRSDIHTLFDRGYVTVTADLRFEVSRRIKEEFENGRAYYALHGQTVRSPQREDWTASPEFLEWHASNVYRG
jgi:putative restriction endonuclease